MPTLHDGRIELIDRTARIPGPRRPVAIARLVRALISDPCPALDRTSETYGSTFAVRLGPTALVVVGDPDHLGQLLMSPNDAFVWGHRLNILRFFVGDTSLIVSDGDAHRRRRSQVQPGFARRHLDEWAPMIVAETDRMIDEEILAREGRIDLFPIERMLVLRLVLNVLFGAGLNERADEIGRLIEPGKEYLEQPAFRQIPHPFPFTRRSRARSGRDALAALVHEEIARRRERRSGEVTDLLDTLVAEPDETRLTDEEICDQVITLIGAGYDTTTSALAWTTIRASGDVEVWSRLRAEADEVFAEPVGPATASRLRYAAAVVKETLRLHPAGTFSPRKAVCEVKIGAHTISRGSMVLWSPYLAGRDASIWEEPLAFRPERHLDPTPEMVAAANHAWVPFGAGPRRCIGFALAQMELTLMIARLAQRVDLRPAVPGVPHPYGMVVNRPLGGVPVTASAR